MPVLGADVGVVGVASGVVRGRSGVFAHAIPIATANSTASAMKACTGFVLFSMRHGRPWFRVVA
jgi:hypothetical protein